MPMTNFPDGFAHGGLSVRGMPLLQMQQGQVFFCGNGPVLRAQQKVGSNNNRGTFLDPFATLSYALTMCKGGRGDIVFVLPGHAETYSSSSACTLSTSDVAVIGLGSGTSRPQFTLDTATSTTINITGNNMSIQNCQFVANFAAIVSAFTMQTASVTASITGTVMTVTVVGSGTLHAGDTLTGTGVTLGTAIVNQITGTTGGVGTYNVTTTQTTASTTVTTLTKFFALENCEFRDNSSSLNFVALVTTIAVANAADGLSMTNCRISSLGTTAATTAIKLLQATDRVSIRGNFGNWAVLNDTAAMLDGSSFNHTNFEFAGNRLNKPNTSSTGGSFVSGSGTAWTGHAYDNYLWQLDGSAGIWIPTGTKLAFSQNFSPITGAADKSGLINPAAV